MNDENIVLTLLESLLVVVRVFGHCLWANVNEVAYNGLCDNAFDVWDGEAQGKKNQGEENAMT